MCQSVGGRVGGLTVIIRLVSIQLALTCQLELSLAILHDNVDTTLTLRQDHFRDNFKDSLKTTKLYSGEHGTTQPKLVSNIPIEYFLHTHVIPCLLIN